MVMLGHRPLLHIMPSLDLTALSLITTRPLMLALAASSAYSPQPSSPLKCSAPSDTLLPSPKRRPSGCSHCFQCGHIGHMPGSDCQLNTTTGKPVTAITTGAHSRHALVTSNGKHYCFLFGKNSFCSYGNNCINHHTCSLCNGTNHGAGNCKSVS